MSALWLSASNASARSRFDHPTELEEANLHWHNAGIAEINHENAEALQEYLAVIEAVQHCPPDVREWFVGTAELAIARCEARSNNVEATRIALLSALEHHFWNFDIIRIDPMLANVVGGDWLDSTLHRWEKIRSTEKLQWHCQKPVFFFPDSSSHSGVPSRRKTLPLVIALHGGNANYHQFADQWKDIANKENIIVAIPAAPDRVSDVSNSWNTSFDVNDLVVQRLIDSMIARGAVDSSQIFLTGYSQGAEQALEMVLVHPDRIRGALLFSGFIQQEVPDEMLAEAAKDKIVVCALSGQYEASTLYGSLVDLSRHASNDGLHFDLERIPGMMHEVPLDLDARFHDLWLTLNGAGRSASGALVPAK